MEGDPRSTAHAVVARMTNDSPWHLHPAQVRDRLHDLVDHPEHLRQGRLNLCGPAAAMMLWLRRDPAAVATFAATLWADGAAALGGLRVRPGAHVLTARPHDSVHAADFMLLAALRDSANRVLPYRGGGLREAAAAMTLPGAVVAWLRAAGRHSTVRSETSLASRRPLSHAAGLDPAGHDVLLLVAQELLRPTWHAGHHVRRLLPNHWIVALAPVVVEADVVRLRCWTWGEVRDAVIPRRRFARCYYGAITALSRRS